MFPLRNRYKNGGGNALFHPVIRLGFCFLCGKLIKLMVDCGRSLLVVNLFTQDIWGLLYHEVAFY